MTDVYGMLGANGHYHFMDSMGRFDPAIKMEQKHSSCNPSVPIECKPR